MLVLRVVTLSSLRSLRVTPVASQILCAAFAPTQHGRILMAEAAATLTTALTGANNDMDFTARAKGAVGNLLSLEYLSGSSPQTEAVAVTANKISVTLGQDVDITITSTAAT